NWERFYANETRYRVPLPTYPFERQRYWVDPPEIQAEEELEIHVPEKKQDIADWFYVPEWRAANGNDEQPVSAPSNWLVLNDDLGFGNVVAQQLRNAGHR